MGKRGRAREREGEGVSENVVVRPHVSQTTNVPHEGLGLLSQAVPIRERRVGGGVLAVKKVQTGVSGDGLLVEYDADPKDLEWLRACMIGKMVESVDPFLVAELLKAEVRRNLTCFFWDQRCGGGGHKWGRGV
ncbi:unnamed protein product [Lupinus luteus]|uniref:Uncharacterized protein n=1 Tax=Lupinus luteus TaxID=3873 RepID=A0AAV1X1L8_LUPLU